MKATESSSKESAFDRWVRLQLDVLVPLGRQGDKKKLVEAAENILKNETDHRFRQLVIDGVSSILHVNGWKDESLAWCRRAVVEAPDDPIAYNALATWYFFKPVGEPSHKDLETALAYNAAALEKARATNTWRRLVLHDRCRIATAAKQFEIVAEAMEEILEVWANPCDSDVPTFEWDWLNGAPEGAVNQELVRRYRGTINREMRSKQPPNLKGDGRET